MNTKLSDAQKQRIDELVERTLSALCEDICIPDMSDIDENSEGYYDKEMDRTNVLYVEALNYLKNNLH
jgi:hypothetical protein